MQEWVQAHLPPLGGQVPWVQSRFKTYWVLIVPILAMIEGPKYTLLLLARLSRWRMLAPAFPFRANLLLAIVLWPSL